MATFIVVEVAEVEQVNIVSADDIVIQFGPGIGQHHQACTFHAYFSATLSVNVMGSMNSCDSATSADLPDSSHNVQPV